MAEKVIMVPIDKKPRNGDMLWYSNNGKDYYELKITGWNRGEIGKNNIARFKWIGTDKSDSIIVYFPSENRFNSFLFKAVREGENK